MPAIFDYPLTVQPSDIDRLGHVNNLAYLAWMLDAAVAHSNAQGWTAERYEQLGAGWVVRSHQITYLQPAFVGEGIVVRTWVADMTAVSSRRRFKVIRASDQRTLARAVTQWAFVDYARMRLRRVPEEIIRAYEIVGDEAITPDDT
jgi:acyl-CoA thioester hydrolase